MGGPGSGGRRHGFRQTVDACYSLGVNQLRRLGAFDDGGMAAWADTGRRGRFGDHIHWETDTDAGTLALTYGVAQRVGGSREHCEQFELSRSYPTLGGSRWWIVCTCGRRVAALFRPPSAVGFRCRLCYRLNYRSQHEGKEAHAFRMAKGVLVKLNWVAAISLVPADVLDGIEFPPRPRGMRRGTYQRLASDWQHWTDKYVRHALQSMNRVLMRFQDAAKP